MSAYNRNSGFLNGKGFYLALALCLAGAGAAAYFTAGEPPVSEVKDERPYTVKRFEPEQVKKTERSESESAAPVHESKAETERELASLKEELETAAAPAAPVAEKAEQVFTTPVSGEVYAPFSNGELVKNETLGDWRTHNGVDIRADEGTEVRSVSSGTVTSVSEDPLWGLCVTVDHGGGLHSVCRGLAAETTLTAGDKLSAGDVIGKVGQVPAESLLPAHLHFELRQNGELIDPAEFLGL